MTELRVGDRVQYNDVIATVTNVVLPEPGQVVQVEWEVVIRYTRTAMVRGLEVTVVKEAHPG